jgi:hypothetical protein
MRNKVELYIEGLRADLDNGSFLLLNYTMEDLSNPTIVRNSFSRQITLKGTPRNDEIFGHIHRNDRNTLYGSPYTGPYFDPCRKTSFVIYNEMMEILESGYLKLDGVTTKGKRHEYKVTLYGGLGSFLYGLSYDSSGNKLTLADLDFGETLDFDIDRETVLEAWDVLAGNSVNAKWDILNFAPAYNGKPASPFDAKKCLVHNESVGLPVRDGDYAAQGGFSLVTLDSEVTEQEAKDYRSYLQRPVLRMKELINAICDSSNNGGWTVNLDAEFFVNTNPYWEKAWLTLPLLNELNLDIVHTSGWDNFSGGTFTIPGGGNLSKLYTVDVNFAMVGSGGTLANTMYKLDLEDDWAAGMSPDDSPGYYLNWLEFEVIAKDANDVVLRQFTWRVSTKQPPEYYPQMDVIIDGVYEGFTLIKNGTAYAPHFTIQEYGLAKVTVNYSQKGIAWGHLNGSADEYKMWPEYSYDMNDGEFFRCDIELSGSTIDYDLSTSSTARTGATITKAALLSGGNTPADYLLSYCKMFGLQLVCHKDAKVVDILLRKNLYNGGTVDINGRIDRGKEISKKPFSFDARWYAWRNGFQGDFAEYYANKYGRPYGEFRVNTGYGFDAAERSMTDGILFSGGVEVLETSKFFCDLVDGSTPIPAVFLGGGKYELYKGGESKSYDLPSAIGFGKTWLNTSLPMHDDKPKLQFHGKDNGHIDERDTLVFYDGMYTPASGHITLSDDTREMMSMNGNNPCWMPGYCDYDSDWLLAGMPKFSRYLMSGSSVSKSLDFGDPLEAQIPSITFGAGSAVFAQYWEKYIGDRYDDDSAVVTCYVDFRGVKVDENLFRQFYAFDGAIWALNKIIDHSLTTSGCTKCEFVKVQSTTNYTTN